VQDLRASISQPHTSGFPAAVSAAGTTGLGRARPGRRAWSPSAMQCTAVGHPSTVHPGTWSPASRTQCGQKESVVNGRSRLRPC